MNIMYHLFKHLNKDIHETIDKACTVHESSILYYDKYLIMQSADSLNSHESIVKLKTSIKDCAIGTKGVVSTDKDIYLDNAISLWKELKRERSNVKALYKAFKDTYYSYENIYYFFPEEIHETLEIKKPKTIDPAIDEEFSKAVINNFRKENSKRIELIKLRIFKNILAH